MNCSIYLISTEYWSVYGQDDGTLISLFISMAKIILARRDSYLAHVKSGIKPDTLSALRQAPFHMATLFPDSSLKRRRKRILLSMKTRGNLVLPATKRVSIILMKGGIGHLIRAVNLINETGKLLDLRGHRKKNNGSPVRTHPNQPRASRRITDNYCVTQITSFQGNWMGVERL